MNLYSSELTKLHTPCNWREMARSTFTTVVILLSCCTYFWRSSQAFNCLYSQLDVLKCVPRPDTSWPGPNQFARYYTYIRNRGPYCGYRRNEIIRPIQKLSNLRLLHSPGYNSNENYDNNMLVKYNVQCPTGRVPFLVYNNLQLRGKVCHLRCEDYVTISCATCATSTSCGIAPMDNYYSLWQDRFSIIFRTSRAWNELGFELSVTCFDPIDLNKPGCSNFGGKKKRDLEPFRNMWHEHAERTRRQWAAHAPLLAPEHLDTRLSISRPIWPIWPTFPPRPPLVPRVNVTLRDVVTYRDNTITVGRGGEVVRRFRNIVRLVVRDASGGDHSFTREVVELLPSGAKETVQLRGPGELQLLYSSATFLRDSQPFALSANEKEVVKDLTNELFNVITPDLQEDHPGYLPPFLREGVMQVAHPHLNGRRAAAVAPHLISTSAIRLALLHRNSCNPVVKAAATSTLSIATRQSPTRVESVCKRLSLTRC